jgi:hypothetical protein
MDFCRARCAYRSLLNFIRSPRPGERPDPPVITNGSNRGPDEPTLLQAGWCQGRWGSRQSEMAQETTDDGSRGKGGEEAQGTLRIARTALQVEGKDPVEPPRPSPARRGGAGWHLDAWAGGVSVEWPPAGCGARPNHPRPAPGAPVAGAPRPPVSLTAPTAIVGCPGSRPTQPE